MYGHASSHNSELGVYAVRPHVDAKQRLDQAPSCDVHGDSQAGRRRMPLAVQPAGPRSRNVHPGTSRRLALFAASLIGVSLLPSSAGALDAWPVLNAGFEQTAEQHLPAHWQHGSHDGGDYAFDTGQEEGNRFARITGRAPGGRAYWQQLLAPVAVPAALRVRLRYRGTTSQMDGFVRLRDARNTSTEVSTQRWQVKPNPAEWTEFRRDFPVPKNARQTEQVRPEIVLYARGTGEVCYDDIVLEPLTEFVPNWPEVPDPLAMPFRPSHKMTCQQNPPDFSWPHIIGAERYHLQVSADPDGAKVAAQHDGLEENFHNFSSAFEPGLWFWRVRFMAAGNWSGWTTPRRFRISRDAWPFPVPSVDVLQARIPTDHPRIWTTRASLAAFRHRAHGPRQQWFASIESRVRRDLDLELPTEPTFDVERKGAITAAWKAAHDQLRGKGEAAAERLYRTAFVYLVTGDKTIGQAAVAQLCNLASWDPEGATGYATHDQVHRAITWKSAVAYDWCCELLSIDQAKTTLDMIRARTATMFEQLAVQRPLKRRPYDSHGWTAFGYMGVVAIATLHDLPEADTWFREIVPTYINLLPPWGDEDGGWCQGTAYWQYSQGSNKVFMDALLYASGLDLYAKAYSRNSGTFPLYTLPHGSPRAHFGDGNRHRPSGYHTQHYARLAQMHQNPILQWAKEAVGAEPGSGLSAYFSGADELPARPPVELPPARWFRDIGWVCMHSDLLDPERISFYFKASPMGSFNHSHADQNSFVLNAFGEALAIDSGYYDWYGSPFDKTYTRQTLAHNAITHGEGAGQRIFDIAARGRVNGFVTHPVFDACTGDATEAYGGTLSRAVRHVIYLRPATFVVIDDLAVSSGVSPLPFAWWIHGLSDITIDADEQGATIEQGRARLAVRIHGPRRMAGHRRDQFIGPRNAYPAGQDPVPIRPQGRGANWPEQCHAWFTTPDLPAATIVATLQPYRTGDEQPTIRAETTNGCLVLTTPAAERVVVRLRDEQGAAVPGLRFSGSAAATAEATALLVAGTELDRDGEAVIRADRPVTAVVGKGQACISCDDDSTVSIHAPGTTRCRDDRGRDLPPSAWHTEEPFVVLHLEPGVHTVRFNDSPAPGAVDPVMMPVDIDGQVTAAQLSAARTVSGQRVAWGRLDIRPGLFKTVERPDGLRFDSGDAQHGLVWLTDGQPVTLVGPVAPLRLVQASQEHPLDIVLVEDIEAVRRLCSPWQEAEAFAAAGGGTVSRYTQRQFLSGGIGVGHWTRPGQWLTWRLRLPSAGTCDIVLKLATHVGADRIVALGGQVRRVHIPATPGYGQTPEQWRAVRLPLATRLPAGPCELTMWCVDGLLNLDWIGLAATAATSADDTRQLH